MDERVQVERDPALNEEDGDEETEPDRLEFARDLLVVVSGDEQAHHHPGGEGAEQHVEAEFDRQVHEQDDEEDRNSDR